MEKLDFSESNISHIITHFVGNRGKAQSLRLSSGLTFVPVSAEEFLHRYLFSAVKMEEYFEFSHKEDLQMNEAYSIVNEMFVDRSTFVDDSSNLAKLLYEASVHPQILEGELTVAYIQNVKIGDQYVDAVGMFKSEQESSFLKFNHKESHYELSVDFGYDTGKVDKSCLVFNIHGEEGYEVLITDHRSKGEDARFWKDTFLGLKPMENNFYQTKVAMHMAKNFIDSPITQELELDISDQMELLNKSADYFRTNESFDKGNFEEAVLNKENLVEGYRAFEETFANEHQVEVPTNFDISRPAVKKTSKIFRSILKLDKNFSVYIHGDRSRAERGEDEKGTYYKFYYDVDRQE